MTEQEEAAAYRIITAHLKAYYQKDGSFLIPARFARIFREATGKLNRDFYEDREGPILPNIIKLSIEAKSNGS